MPPISLSYRENLAKIGIAANASVSYDDFYSRPRSLREAIELRNAPTSQEWLQVSDIFRDDFWTDEVQGGLAGTEHTGYSLPMPISQSRTITTKRSSFQRRPDSGR